jgi:hypothetical protein
MAKPLNYSVSREVRPGHVNKGDYVVTAEYVEGYEVLSWHETKAEAVAACKRYEAGEVDKHERSTMQHKREG